MLAFTAGDPAGIGPEVLVAALRDPRVRRACKPVVVGPLRALRLCGWRRGLAPVIDPGIDCPAKPGRSTPADGRASFGAVKLAVDLAARGLVSGMVTAPISKNSWKLAGVPYLDHTEFLEKTTNASRIAMMLLAGDLRAVLVTRHVPLREAVRRIRPRSVVESAMLAQEALKRLGKEKVRVGICAVNPHAGEGGILGLEERHALAPAVRRLQYAGFDVHGPLPADAAWARHRLGHYDVLIAAYHDQAMIPLKFSSPYGIVNWTIGISILRTSPGHGTAFDIAGLGRANPSAMIEAALLAARLLRSSPHAGRSFQT